VSPPKSGKSSPLSEGRKEVICTTKRTLQGVTLPSYPSLRKTGEAPGEKNLNLQLQEHRRLKP
jgi:hypothetical protein